MTEKQDILDYIKQLGALQIITKEELVRAFDEGRPPREDGLNKKLSFQEILYFIGAGIVFAGITIFISQNWNQLTSPTKIISTFGSGIGAYILGLIFTRHKNLESIGAAFHLIAALVLPIGLFVIFDVGGFDIHTSGLQSAVAGLLFAVYLASYALFRKNIFLFFSILFGTWLFFSFTNLIVDGNPLFVQMKFFEYRVLLTGLSYMLLGYSFSQTDIRKPLSGFLNGFGIILFLGAALALGGWSPEINIFWQLLYPVLIFATLYFSIHIQSKAYLTFGTIYLMVYILKLTGEYFSNSLGWPLALVIAGLLLIGSGYLSFQVKRKFLVN